MVRVNPVVITFGMYKGQPVDQLPRGYLEWLLREVNMAPPLRQAVIQALGLSTEADELRAENERLRADADEQRDKLGRLLGFVDAQNADLKRIVDDYYRAAIRFAHPDRGGSTEAAQLLNELRDNVTRLLITD